LIDTAEQVVISRPADWIPSLGSPIGNWRAPVRLLRNDHGMPSEDLRRPLRQRLSRAVRERDRIAVGALRDAIAALDNAEAVEAEAVEPDQDAVPPSSEYVAGGVVGVGAAEAQRRMLDSESQIAIVTADVEARLAAAATYEQHGQSARASELRSGADVLLAVLDAGDRSD
jgi:uncharacterized protein